MSRGFGPLGRLRGSRLGCRDGIRRLGHAAPGIPRHGRHFSTEIRLGHVGCFRTVASVAVETLGLAQKPSTMSALPAGQVWARHRLALVNSLGRRYLPRNQGA